MKHISQIIKEIDYKEKYFNSIQNFGEQHPYFHSKEMNTWRKSKKFKTK